MAISPFGRPATRIRLEPQLARLERDLGEAVKRNDLAVAVRISTTIADRMEDSRKALVADRKLQTNEQIKTSATFVNNIASTLIAVGVATPAVGFFVPSGPFSGNALLMGEISGACLVGALVVHTIARSILRRLRS